MFTGIVQALGRVREHVPMDGGVRLIIDTGKLDLSDVQIGDSIAVNGVCLTATALPRGAIAVDVSAETLACTTGFEIDATVNLEKALRLCDRLGGHLVSGHVDGVGEVIEFEAIGENRLAVVRVPTELSRYVARKGSITIHGVSLTVNEVAGDILRVNLIPHTLVETNLAQLQPGKQVNIEVDLVARYIERMLPG